MPSNGLLLKLPTFKPISRHIDLQSVEFVLCMLVTDRNGILRRVNLDEMAEGIRNGCESDWILNIINVPSRQATRLSANNIGLKQSTGIRSKLVGPSNGKSSGGFQPHTSPSARV